MYVFEYHLRYSNDVFRFFDFWRVCLTFLFCIILVAGINENDKVMS